MFMKNLVILCLYKTNQFVKGLLFIMKNTKYNLFSIILSNKILNSKKRNFRKLLENTQPLRLPLAWWANLYPLNNLPVDPAWINVSGLRPLYVALIADNTVLLA